MTAKDNTRRIVVVDKDKCKPAKCQQECLHICPINRNDRQCIEIEETVVDTIRKKHAIVWESMCIGCALCVKSCPMHAIKLVNIPQNLREKVTHQFRANSFMLHCLPVPRPKSILGILGSNGTGKTTTLRLLGNQILPNMGNYKTPPTEKEILKKFHGTELFLYLSLLFSKQLQVAYKIQFIEKICEVFPPNITIGEVIGSVYSSRELATDANTLFDTLKVLLDIETIWNTPLSKCSGGELQRFAIMHTCVQAAQIYIFDEPSAFLDVKQRINMCKAIRLLTDRSDTYVFVVEHDLAILDHISDYLCLMYGEPGAYGMVSAPFSVRKGINQFLDGYDTYENIRFRSSSLSFKITDDIEDMKTTKIYAYPAIDYSVGNFSLHFEHGEFATSDIIVLLGENGTGKSTLIKLFAGILNPNNGKNDIPDLNISYKPQIIVPKFTGTVKTMLNEKIKPAMEFSQFCTDVVKPLAIEDLFDKQIKELSGGELQRVALVLALGKPADIYLIDEPSAFLDCEFRIIAAKVIKRFIMHVKKTAFVVEHDLIMATYLASKLVVFSGVPSYACTATMMTKKDGMNLFLSSIDVTVRQDPTNGRPRVNKRGSQKDQQQKKDKNYYAQ